MSLTWQEVEDIWKKVPESEIAKELLWFFKTYPSHQFCWLVPAQYAEGDWTAKASFELPYSDERRRQYKRGSFERVF